MATIKSYTDLEQSLKLAEILPLESADMCWQYQTDRWVGEPDYKEFPQFEHATDKRDIPCWSLAALLDVLPDELTDSDGCVYRIEFFHLKGKYIMHYSKLSTLWPFLFSAESDNPVDACYEMILKLHELNLL